MNYSGPTSRALIARGPSGTTLCHLRYRCTSPLSPPWEVVSTKPQHRAPQMVVSPRRRPVPSITSSPSSPLISRCALSSCSAPTSYPLTATKTTASSSTTTQLNSPFVDRRIRYTEEEVDMLLNAGPEQHPWVSPVIIGLGSNVGNTADNMTEAVCRLRQLPHTQVVCVSQLISTPPMYVEDQPTFVNACVHLATRLRPTLLLAELKNIERSMGRVKGQRHGPRLIDLDIVLYGGLAVHEWSKREDYAGEEQDGSVPMIEGGDEQVGMTSKETILVASPSASLCETQVDKTGSSVDPSLHYFRRGTITLPHKGMCERQFVLDPLLTLAAIDTPFVPPSSPHVNSKSTSPSLSSSISSSLLSTSQCTQYITPLSAWSHPLNGMNPFQLAHAQKYGCPLIGHLTDVHTLQTNPQSLPSITSSPSSTSSSSSSSSSLSSVFPSLSPRPTQLPDISSAPLILFPQVKSRLQPYYRPIILPQSPSSASSTSESNFHSPSVTPPSLSLPSYLNPLTNDPLLATPLRIPVSSSPTTATSDITTSTTTTTTSTRTTAVWGPRTTLMAVINATPDSFSDGSNLSIPHPPTYLSSSAPSSSDIKPSLATTSETGCPHLLSLMSSNTSGGYTSPPDPLSWLDSLTPQQLDAIAPRPDLLPPALPDNSPTSSLSSPSPPATLSIPKTSSPPTDHHFAVNIRRSVLLSLLHIHSGATIVDIGGQSTRPNADPISEDVEAQRVLPVVKYLAMQLQAETWKAFIQRKRRRTMGSSSSSSSSSSLSSLAKKSTQMRDDLPPLISIDTFYPGVAERAIALGASIINDVTGGRYDPQMYSVAANTGAALIINHTRGMPKSMSSPSVMSSYTSTTHPLPPWAFSLRPPSDMGLIPSTASLSTSSSSSSTPPSLHSVMDGVSSDILSILRTASLHGVPLWSIIIDPGIGFSKTYEANLLYTRSPHSALEVRIPQPETKDDPSSFPTPSSSSSSLSGTVHRDSWVWHPIPSLARVRLPVLVGPSRKGYIGRILMESGMISDQSEHPLRISSSHDGEPDGMLNPQSAALGLNELISIDTSRPSGRDIATSAAAVVASLNGGHIVRVHNVWTNRQALEVADALRINKANTHA